MTAKTLRMAFLVGGCVLPMVVSCGNASDSQGGAAVSANQTALTSVPSSEEQIKQAHEDLGKRIEATKARIALSPTEADQAQLLGDQKQYFDSTPGASADRKPATPTAARYSAERIRAVAAQMKNYDMTDPVQEAAWAKFKAEELAK